MILHGNNDQQLVLEVAELGPPGTPADDDLLLNVSVVVGSYSVADQCWVVDRDWHGFMVELCQLERTRRGHADLVGASPDEFKIRFANTDDVGHMSVSGTVGWHAPDGFFQKLEFGFPFDPGMLGAVVRELGAFSR